MSVLRKAELYDSFFNTLKDKHHFICVIAEESWIAGVFPDYFSRISTTSSLWVCPQKVYVRILITLEDERCFYYVSVLALHLGLSS